MVKFVWNVSERNSAIHFKAKYFKIGHINGHFRKVYGEVIAGAHLEDPDVELFIQASSIETMDDALDLKLKSANVLNAAEHPNMIFSAKGGCYMSSGRIWELKGFLKFKDRIIPLTMVLSLLKRHEGFKKTMMQAQLFGRINLKDLGIDLLSENGVSDEIEVYADVYMIKEAVATVGR